MESRIATTIEQSKILAEILPLESADMYYCYGMDIHTKKWDYDSVPTIIDASNQIDICDIPCWSLASLLNILAKIANKIDDDGSVDLSSFMGQWSVNMFDCSVEATDNYDNPIDACVAMIEKLHKLNLL